MEWLKKVRGVRYCVPLVHLPGRRKCQGSPVVRCRAALGLVLLSDAVPRRYSRLFQGFRASGSAYSQKAELRSGCGWAAPGRFERLRPAVLRFPGRSAPPALLFRSWAAAPPRACRAFDLFAILPPRVLPFRSSSPSFLSLPAFRSLLFRSCSAPGAGAAHGWAALVAPRSLRSSVSAPHWLRSLVLPVPLRRFDRLQRLFSASSFCTK